MIAQPPGWLSRVARIAQSEGALLIADEIMTGFGRTGLDRSEAFGLAELHTERNRPEAPVAGESGGRNRLSASAFACHHEVVQPDLLAMAKGLSGGYLPLAATLTSQAIFEAFLGEYADFKTFFHGHSFTGNQLSCTAALASLELLNSPDSRRARRQLFRAFSLALKDLWELPAVGDIRQVGLIVGVELVKDRRTREPFALTERVGIRVCEAMARRGVLTRPVGNVVVLMPPYCTTSSQVNRMVAVLAQAIEETLTVRTTVGCAKASRKTSGHHARGAVKAEPRPARPRRS